MPERNEFNPDQPIIDQVDLAGAWDSVSEAEAVVDKVKELGIY
jgi:hypothetical protein